MLQSDEIKLEPGVHVQTQVYSGSPVPHAGGQVGTQAGIGRGEGGHDSDSSRNGGRCHGSLTNEGCQWDSAKTMNLCLRHLTDIRDVAWAHRSAGKVGAGALNIVRALLENKSVHLDAAVKDIRGILEFFKEFENPWL